MKIFNFKKKKKPARKRKPVKISKPKKSAGKKVTLDNVIVKQPLSYRKNRLKEKALRNNKNDQIKGQLSKKDKKAIIRGIILGSPDYKRYGYQQKIINIFREEFEVEISGSSISYYIKEIEEDWHNDNDNRESRQKVKDMYIGLWLQADKIKNQTAKLRLKREILTEMVKIDGMFEQKINLSGGLGNMNQEDTEKLYKEALEDEGKGKKGKS